MKARTIYLLVIVLLQVAIYKINAQNISEKPFVYSDDLQEAAKEGDADALYKKEVYAKKMCTFA